MAKALPAPIDHFLLQADLTVVVPGPLERDLADELAAVADRRIRRRGDGLPGQRADRSGVPLTPAAPPATLHSLFAKHSKTPVPQGLTYLIDDVARRHGQLRVGMAASFVRCEDPALLAQAVAAPAIERLDVRLLAPTVAVSQAPIAEVLAALREAGFAPAAEDSAGAIVDVRARGARVPAPTTRRRGIGRCRRPNAQTLGAIVAVLRKVAATPFSRRRGSTRPRPWPSCSRPPMDQSVGGHRLRRCRRRRHPARGGPDQRPRRPTDRAIDPASGRVREFAIHRVTSVVSPSRDNGPMTCRKMQSTSTREGIAHDRRAPDRPVRQDRAARGRPRAGRRSPGGHRAVRRAGTRPRTRAHLSHHPAGAVERPRRGPRRRAGGRRAGRFSRYAVPQPLLVDIVDTMARYGRLQLVKSPVHGLVLVSLDRAVLEEVLRNKKIAPMLGARIDDDTVIVHPVERGRVKQMLLKIGWPAEDLAGYVNGEAHPIEPGRRTAGSCGTTSRWRPTRSGRAAPAWWCCHAARARPWSARRRWPRPGATTLILVTNTVAGRQWKRELSRGRR